MTRLAAFMLIALATSANASQFIFPLIRQSIESGGAGTRGTCPVVAPDTDGVFNCNSCVSDESCPDNCCYHEFKGSLITTALLCEIDGCCLRVMNDGTGTQLWAGEGLTAKGRRADGSVFCGELEANDECPNCAYAYQNGAEVLCSAGFTVPARNQEFDGALCSQGSTAEDAKTPGESEDAGGSRDGAGVVETEKQPDAEVLNEDTGETSPQTENATADKSVDEELKDENAEKDESNEAESAEGTSDRNDSSATTKATKDGSPSKGLIAGATVCALGLLTGFCLLALLCFRRRQRRKAESKPFVSLQHTPDVERAMESPKKLTNGPHPTSLPPGDRISGGIGSSYTPPGSNDSWPNSPPKRGVKGRRRPVSPLAPLQRPMPCTPPESDGSECDDGDETENVDRDVGRTQFSSMFRSIIPPSGSFTDRPTSSRPTGPPAGSFPDRSSGVRPIIPPSGSFTDIPPGTTLR